MNGNRRFGYRLDPLHPAQPLWGLGAALAIAGPCGVALADGGRSAAGLGLGDRSVE